MIPRNILIYNSSTLSSSAKVLGQLRKLFTEIDHNSSTFSDRNLLSLQERKFTKRIKIQKFLMSCLSLEDINNMIMTRNFTYLDKVLNSTARLTQDVPIKCDFTHIFISFNYQNEKSITISLQNSA